MDNANTRTDHSTTEDVREIHPAVITWSLVVGLIVAFAVTASSFTLSFTTLLDLATMAGMRDSAWVIPVVLDGPILAASILRIALSQHTDRRTVLGRRFIVAVFALAGLASMAGNAYHAVLTVTDLNSAVAAALAALAPLMVMTMGEMMSVAISAPRRRTAETSAVHAEAVTSGVANDAVAPPRQDKAPEPITADNPVVDEDVDNGLLKPAVWASVHLWLEHPDMSNSDIARELGVHTSTVGRHLKAWNEVQRKIAQSRSIEYANDTQQLGSTTKDTVVDDDAGHVELDVQYDAESPYAGSANFDYAGAAR